jgi:hypothetical protein
LSDLVQRGAFHLTTTEHDTDRWDGLSIDANIADLARHKGRKRPEEERDSDEGMHFDVGQK